MLSVVARVINRFIIYSGLTSPSLLFSSSEIFLIPWSVSLIRHPFFRCLHIPLRVSKVFPHRQSNFTLYLATLTTGGPDSTFSFWSAVSPMCWRSVRKETFLFPFFPLAVGTAHREEVCRRCICIAIVWKLHRVINGEGQLTFRSERWIQGLAYCTSGCF
jgi:hypothetical protein